MRRDLRSFYGSNFMYELRQYVQEDSSGLAKYGVHYSNIPKWGLNVETKYFPIGVYFYILSTACDIKTGFATERLCANIARLDNTRLLILKEGHERNYEGDVIELLNYMFELDEKRMGAGNKELHRMGYDGIVDYDGIVLPIESCQGVITWPSGATYITSLRTQRVVFGVERLERVCRRLAYIKPGTLQLTRGEIHKVITMRPKFQHRWDTHETLAELYGHLLKALNFVYLDSWEWAEDLFDQYPEYTDLFQNSLVANPTIPKPFWYRMYRNDPRQHMRELAKDVLQ